MADYRVGLGHDLVFDDLELIYPEPAGGIALPVERKYSISGKVNDIGLYIPFHWDMLEGENDYIGMLTQFGLHLEDNVEVTVYAKTPKLQWAIFNGVATLPQAGEDMRWQSFFPRDITVYIIDLEQIT